MPRQARIDAPGALHHIIARGIGRRKIFNDREDRNRFIERLSQLIKETQTGCYAWALLPNHFHLLLRTGAKPIATLMRRLLTGHAISFNPACSGTTAVQGTYFKTDTNRFSARKSPTCWSWCATFT